VREPNAFTGAALDRAADGRRRDGAWLAAQRAHPHARALIAGSAGVRAPGGAIELEPLERALDGAAGEPILLGLDATGPVFAIDEDERGDATRPGFIGAGGRRGEPGPQARDRLGLREAASLLAQAEGGLVAYAAAVLNWHRSHRFCANCGSAAELGEGGMLRRCPACAATHHPRVDPVVIMLVTGGQRVLLGRQRSWPARRYSALAGFVGPGETLEEAVAREVEEEAGVLVEAPAYVSSQPWPFPASLMLGFIVPWRSGEIGGRDEELQDARWFERDEVAESAREDPAWDAGTPDDGDGLLLPPRSAIARRLIERWLSG
jgi:NAD+ diphosphatase